VSIIKRCNKCKKNLPKTSFTSDRTKKDGLDATCRDCRKVRVHAFRAAAKQARPTAPMPAARAEKAPAPPPLPPLESAERAHVEAANKRDLKREHAALVAETIRLRAEVRAAAQAAGPLPEIWIPKKTIEQSEGIAAALASDWHVDELVSSGSTLGLNEYSPEIAKQRSQYFFQHFLRLSDIMARDCEIRTLWIGILGDLFSGWIHEELLAGTAMAPGKAAHYAQTLLYSGIRFLLENSDYNIVIDALPGNHGRMTKKMHFNDPTGTSLETMAYHMLAARFAEEPRVTIKVAEHAQVIRPFFDKFKMRLIHGYEIKFAGGIGGPTIPINKRLAQWNSSSPCQLTCMGHFHHYMDGGNFMMNGSLIGYNAYAQTNGFAYEEPQQSFFLIHNRHGGQKSVTAPIWLDGKEHP